MNCKACFKIYTNSIGDDELGYIIESIGIKPGITDGCLYYGLNMVSTDDEHFQFSVFVHVTLASLFPKKNLLIELKNSFQIQYEVNVKFSDLEEEINLKRSFNLSDDTISFIKDIDAYYCFNKEYIDL